MGRDLTLYPKSATKKELKDFIESLGFIKCNHLWDWPAGTLNYHWFDYTDFKSIDGVSADIFPVSKDENLFTNNEWAIHVRNLYSASIFDVKMLNNVLRLARKNFGGTITGDYGTNRYADEWEDHSTPISRGITRIYENVSNTIGAIKFSLPENQHALKRTSETKKDQDFFDFINSMTPTRVLYNGLVPFVISMFEYFFSEVFQILLKYDDVAQEKIKTHRQKVDFQVLLEVEEKSRTPENVIAMNYTFQNLNQLNKAYKEWLNIDVRKILFKKKKIGNSISFLENRIADIIEYRHGIVHHFMIDRTLSREDYLNLLKTVELCIHEVISFLERKYCFKCEV